jgi:hypothetical protein
VCVSGIAGIEPILSKTPVFEASSPKPEEGAADYTTLRCSGTVKDVTISSVSASRPSPDLP